MNVANREFQTAKPMHLCGRVLAATSPQPDECWPDFLRR
jgi:hypothetical protein